MDQAAVDWLSSCREVLYEPTLVDSPDKLGDVVEAANALIVRNRTQVNRLILDRAPGLKCVGRLGVGLDNIDTGACEERGVSVYPAYGANTNAVAEYVITTAMVLLRGAYGSFDRMCAGEWPRNQMTGSELRNKKFALVGFGGISQYIANLVRVFGVELSAFDPFFNNRSEFGNVKFFDHIDEMLAQADIVSIHVPLTDQTAGLFSRERIGNMRPGAVLINTSRGGIVNEDALIKALRNGHLKGAAMDVFDKEPLKKEDSAKFSGVPGLILTPHIAGVTIESNQQVSAMIAKLVDQHLTKS